MTGFLLILPKGCYNLALPVVSCTSCDLMWSPSVKDFQRGGYWPGTLNFCTLYRFQSNARYVMHCGHKSNMDLYKNCILMFLFKQLSLCSFSTSEQGNFEGDFIEEDEEVAEFVKYIQRHTNDVRYTYISVLSALILLK